jgi:hypothetical protein
VPISSPLEGIVDGSIMMFGVVFGVSVADVPMLGKGDGIGPGIGIGASNID